MCRMKYYSLYNHIRVNNFKDLQKIREMWGPFVPLRTSWSSSNLKVVNSVTKQYDISKRCMVLCRKISDKIVAKGRGNIFFLWPMLETFLWLIHSCCVEWEALLSMAQVKFLFFRRSHRVTHISSPFYQHGLTLILASISNHMPSKVWDEITYPFINFNGCTVEV